MFRTPLIHSAKARWTAALASVSLITVGLVGLSMLPAKAQDAACSFAAGAGTEASPYLVGTVSDLEMVRSCHGSASGLNFQMSRAISLSSVVNWTPIGTDEFPFVDTFDGGGFTISNLVSEAIDASGFSGLFGKVGGETTDPIQTAEIRGLNIINASVLQYREDDSAKAGILIAEAGRGVLVEDVTISNSVIAGSRDLGAVVGDGNSIDLVFNDIDVSNVRVTTPGYPAPYSKDVAQLAIFAGHLYEHVSIRDVRVVDSFVEIASVDDVYKIGGFHTGCDEEMLFRDSSLTGVEINITSGASVWDVAGFSAGDSYLDDACNYDNIVAEAQITIDAAQEVFEIGGFGSQAEEIFVTNSKTDVSIDISANRVYMVGGVLGDSKEGFRSTYANSEFESHISIETTGEVLDDQNAVHEIGLFLGSNNRFTIQDTLLTGSVSVTVPAGEAVSGVSNLIGLQRGEQLNQMRDLRNVVVNAQPLAVSIGGNTSSYSPYSHLIGATENGSEMVQFFGNGVFWNSTISPGFSSDEIGDPASQRELSSQSFLEAAGYNFDRDWCVIDGEARVASVNLGCIGDSNNQSETDLQPPSVSVVASGSGSFDSSGGLLQLEGAGLQGLGQVKLAGQALFVQTLSDIRAAVLIPAGLAAGTYDLEITGLYGTLRMQNAVSITAPSVDIEPGYWTQMQPNGTVKMYAKNIIGEGKVQFYQNSVEVAWIQAVDALDPKLAGANGYHYLVRTRELVNGKNAFEIYRDGSRVWRAAYSK